MQGFEDECVPEINVFLHFTQKCKMATKKWLENNFWEKLSLDSVNTLGAQNFVEIAIFCIIFEINVLLRFMQKIQDGKTR